MVFLPSLAVVCIWRSPRMSESSTRRGQGGCGGGVDFAAVFAQLGREEVEAELRVNLLFSCAGDATFAFQGGEGIFVEREAHLKGAAADGDVVFLGAGEIKKSRAVALWFEQANVDLRA